MNKKREINSIKLTFNENVQKHFLQAKTEKSDAKKRSSDEDPSYIKLNFYASQVVRFTPDNLKGTIDLLQ